LPAFLLSAIRYPFACSLEQGGLFRRPRLDLELAVRAHPDERLAALLELAEQQFLGQRPLDVLLITRAIGRAPIFGS